MAGWLYGFLLDFLYLWKKYSKMVAQRGLLQHKKKGDKIPEALIYEVMDGKPIYYKGYRDVLNKTKTLEEIMACSRLQGIIVSLMVSRTANIMCYGH